MCNGVSGRFRRIVSGLVAIATTAVLGVTLQASRDTERLQGQDLDLAGSTLRAGFQVESGAPGRS